MNRLTLIIPLLLCMMIIPTSVFAHKLIPTDGSNNDIVSALEIPDPIVSWAMYEELSNNVLYYKFDAKKDDRLFSSIVIPKLDNLENRIEYIESIDGEDIKRMLEESENE